MPDAEERWIEATPGTISAGAAVVVVVVEDVVVVGPVVETCSDQPPFSDPMSPSASSTT